MIHNGIKVHLLQSILSEIEQRYNDSEIFIFLDDEYDLRVTTIDKCDIINNFGDEHGILAFEETDGNGDIFFIPTEKIKFVQTRKIQ